MVAVLAVLAIGGEYATGMIRVTLAAIPRRRTALAAKAAVVVAVVAPCAAAAVAGSAAAGRCLAPAASRVATTEAGRCCAPAVGSVLYLVAGRPARASASPRRCGNSAAAIGVVLGLLYVLPIVILAVADAELAAPPAADRPDRRAGHPGHADLDALPIGPWAGLGVLAAWAAAALLGGGVLFLRRDA